MATSLEIVRTLLEEGNVAKAHYQVWWALRNLALPNFYSEMNEQDVRLFFHASNSGHYKLMFVALGKIFDSDARASGIRTLKDALRAEGKGQVADQLEAQLADMTPLVEKILNLRNRTIIHNEHALSREKAYELNGGVTANDIRDLIDAAGEAINSVAESLGYSSRVTYDNAFESATLAMLQRLRDGQAKLGVQADG